jgi:hypothetical protein
MNWQEVADIHLEKEKDVQKRLHSELGGQREVIVRDENKLGRIDLLTADELIEVKHIKNWSAAIQQIQQYSKHYPDRKLRVHLFGLNDISSPNEEYLAAKKILEKLEIKVSWEP